MKHTLHKKLHFNRLTTTSILALIFVFFISCSKDEIVTDTISKSLDITIDNKNLKITNTSISSNENCNGLFVTCKYESPTDNGFRIQFSLNKNGAIKNITLVDYHNGNAQFESADFNPTGLITISNFNYDEAKKYLHFDFKGELVELNIVEKFDVDRKRKHIEGAITITDVKNTECTSFSSDLSFKTSNLNFSTSTTIAKHVLNLNTNPYQFYFYSDNGYRSIFKSKTDLWNLEKGTYTFDQNSLENRIDFEQYIGNFRATQLVFIRDIDWKKHQTTGSYTITEHQIINGLKVTKGEFNLQVFDNEILTYDIKNAKFEVIGF
jgi:hypothetical protein